MTRLAVVIAAYDEAANVEELTRRLHAALAPLAAWEWELVFVVEGRDGTREVLERLAGELGRLRVLYREAPTGLGNAFRRGFAAVAPDTDVVVTLDADLNHQPEEIPRLLAAAAAHDVVVGSRLVAGSRVDGTPAWKRALSGTVNLLMRTVFALPVADLTSGFRVYRAGVLRRLDYRDGGFAFLPEMLLLAHRAGCHVREEPIHFVFRRQGASKMGFWATSLSYLRLLAWRWRSRSLPAPAASGSPR